MPCLLSALWQVKLENSQRLLAEAMVRQRQSSLASNARTQIHRVVLNR